MNFAGPGPAVFIFLSLAALKIYFEISVKIDYFVFQSTL
jgi:hypothetical protein